MALTRGFIRNAATTPLDARLMDMAQIVGNADGTPRPGVLDGDGRTLVTALSSMNVAVATADFVATKGVSDGVSIYTNDGVTNVAIPAAPASNSRIDVIWTRHQDSTTGDGASTPIFGVTSGAAAATPTKPAIPTGALELATLRVYTGTTAANGGANVLTNTYQMTASRGGVVPFRTYAELAAWTNPLKGQIARDLETGDLFLWNGSAWRIQDGGTKLLIPTAVTNATLDADGTIRPNAGATVIRIDGVFSAKYRTYIVEWSFNFAAKSTLTIRMCSGGTPYTGANYYYQRMLAQGSAIGAGSGSNLTSWPGAGITESFVYGTTKFKNPARVSPKFIEVDTAQAPGVGLAIDRGWIGAQDSSIFDGFEITSTAGINAGDASFLKVYGMA